jgi:two-component system chemotaxis response regulator CheY
MVLDLNMPDLHGLDVLKFVRSHPSLGRLPVLVLTTRGDESSRDAATAAGATDYMTKPFAPQELAARVRRLLEATGTAPAAGGRHVE